MLTHYDQAGFLCCKVFGGVFVKYSHTACRAQCIAPQKGSAGAIRCAIDPIIAIAPCVLRASKKSGTARVPLQVRGIAIVLDRAYQAGGDILPDDLVQHLL